MDFKTLQIAVIGSGVMGESFVAGFLRNQLLKPDQISCSDPSSEKLDHLRTAYGVSISNDNKKFISDANIVILSVKPQHMQYIYSELRGKIPTDAIIISIIAGVKIDSLQSGLDHSCVVRVMPNTPSQIGQGISVWTSQGLSTDQKEIAQKVLQSLGEDVYLEDESYLDMATALSGTGPAYGYLFMEAMIDAGVHLGFPRNIAEKLVIQTFKGTVNYYESKKDHPAALRNEVTSPGGTSAAALYYLEKAGFRTAISRAVWAAYLRSRELGDGKKTQAPENGL